jgi:sporulation integral membrane protein YtvI
LAGFKPQTGGTWEEYRNMKSYLGRVGNWFSPRFLAWLRAFLLFFAIYTLFAVILRYTIAYTIPFLIGLGIAVLSQPLIRFASRRLKMKESVGVWLSPLITIILLLAIIGSIGFLAVRELIGLMTRIPQINPQAILTAVENFLITNELPFTLPVFDMDYLVAFISDNRDTILSGLSQALSWAGMVAGWAITFVTSLPTWLMLFIVIFFSAFTFTKNYNTLKGYVRSLFSDAAIQSGHRTWADGLQMLGRYVRSYLLIYFLTFLQTFILFLILDIDYPLIWSALVGVSDLIPILGPGTIYIPMAIVRGIAGDWRVALFLILGWLFITVVRQFVESKVVADSINIHPLFMLAVLFIAFQAGSFGLLIYLTFLLVFYNLLKHSGMLRPLFPVKDAPPKQKRLRGKWRKNKGAQPEPVEKTPFEAILSGPPASDAGTDPSASRTDAEPTAADADAEPPAADADAEAPASDADAEPPVSDDDADDPDTSDTADRAAGAVRAAAKKSSGVHPETAHQKGDGKPE